MEAQKRTMNWTPKCFSPRKKDEQGEEVGDPVVLYTGHLVLEIPDNEFMCDVLAELGMSDKESLKASGVKLLMDAYRRCKHLILSAEVIREKDKAKLNLEDVLHEPGLRYLPIEFGGKMLREGFGPGEE